LFSFGYRGATKTLDSQYIVKNVVDYLSCRDKVLRGHTLSHAGTSDGDWDIDKVPHVGTRLNAADVNFGRPLPSCRVVWLHTQLLGTSLETFVLNFLKHDTHAHTDTCMKLVGIADNKDLG